jgi:hypothetical protein
MEDSAWLIRIAMFKLSQHAEIDTCCTIWYLKFSYS